MKNVTLSLAALAAMAFTGSAQAVVKIGNDMGRCSAGKGPSVLVTIRGLKSSTGKVRVQSYRATKAEWLKKGRGLTRIETKARAGTMSFCMPFSKVGNYAIAVRHDKNNNGKTDIFSDGGGMSNNPSINIFNLGKPSVKKVAFYVGSNVKRITINMKYR